MDPESWQAVQELFEKVLTLPPAARGPFLDQECGRDELRIEVASLLAAHDHPDARLAMLELLAPDAWEGRQIGAYLLDEELGRGGMSIVYLGRRVKSDFEQKVAIKLVKPGLGAIELGQRLASERQIMARLSHPNIARLFDGGTTPEGLPYFVMEYVDGLRIDDYCTRHELDIEQRIELFCRACEAVQYAHRNLIVHRDIKPSNLMVRRDGVPILLDFGIAKLLDPGEEVDTQSWVRPMTRRYASPEQCRGESVSTVSDVYSLGILLHELMVGRPEADDVSDFFPTGLGSDLDAILQRAIQPEVEERYSSVELFQADLRRFLTGQPVAARGGGIRYRAGKFIRRNRLAALLSAGLVVTLFVLLLLGALFTVQAVRQRDRAEEEQQRAQQTAQFLIELFDASEAAGGEVAARQLLDQGVDRIADDLGVDPDLKASLDHALGSAYHRMGHYQPARELLERALEQRKQLFGSDHIAVAETLFELSRLNNALGDYRRSEELMRQALALRRKLLGDDDVGLADGLDHLGWLACLKGRFDEAGEFYRQALALRVAHHGETHASISLSLENLAGLESDLGNHAQAEVLYRRALEMGESTLGADHPDLAMTIKSLGLTLRDRGQLDEARQLFERALEIELRVLGDSHSHVAGTLAKLGALLQIKGEYEAAEKYFRRALAIRRNAFGDDHPRVAEVLQNLGKVQMLRGELDAAEVTLQESVQILRQAFPEGAPPPSFPLITLGQVLLARGDPERAESVLREALELRRRFFAPDHPLVVESEQLVAKAAAAIQPATEVDTGESRSNLTQIWAPEM